MHKFLDLVNEAVDNLEELIEKNDGRQTAESSYYLDYLLDSKEELLKFLGKSRVVKEKICNCSDTTKSLPCPIHSLK